MAESSDLVLSHAKTPRVRSATSPSTPLQILLDEAVGWEPPQFAHFPMMLSPKGDKLSKRHASVSVSEYRDKGHPADAVINIESPEPEKIATILPLIRERARDLKDVAHHLDFYFREPPLFDQKAESKFLKPEAGTHLLALADVFSTVTEWTTAALEDAFQAYGEKQEIPMKVYAQPVRVALTGRSASPGLFDVLVVLGKALSLMRLRDGAERARQAG